MVTPRREHRIQTICLILLSVMGAGAAMYWLRPVIVPFVLAVFFTYCLEPFVDWEEKRLRLPRGLAMFIAFFLQCFALILVSLAVFFAATQMAARGDAYHDSVMRLIREMAAAVPLWELGINPEELTKSLERAASQAMGRASESAVGASMGALGKGTLALLFMIFLMMGRVHYASSTDGVQGEVAFSVRRYLTVKFIVSAGTGFAVGAILLFFGVPFALAFGVLAFLLNFIPTIGSIVATLLPIPVVAFNPELSTAVKVMAIVIPGFIQFAVGNIIEPKVMGQSLDLHPVVVMLALIFFGMMWGAAGAFLAAPIVAVIKMLCEKEELTRPIAALLAGRVDAFFEEGPPPLDEDANGDSMMSALSANHHQKKKVEIFVKESRASAEMEDDASSDIILPKPSLADKTKTEIVVEETFSSEQNDSETSGLPADPNSQKKKNGFGRNDLLVQQAGPETLAAASERADKKKKKR
jgi:AI-2 transport protein TqsA